VERASFSLTKFNSTLHEIPILVKDSISVHVMNNTAGSHCLVGARTKKEASLITRLRNAGAIILGKANMSQWGNARSSGDNASNGWSSWGSQTYDVDVTEQDPCGSSIGSVTAMTMGLAAVTVGVEVRIFLLISKRAPLLTFVRRQ
jgi:amidase